jgi:N utilization substance protein B
MKAKSDPRHRHRVDQMKNMFSHSFDPSTCEDPTLVSDIITNLDHIDTLIVSCAPEWPLDQINRIDLAILRISIHELTTKDTPYKVVIDEAVELAKEYGSESSSKFVNGVLGAVLSKLPKN